MDANKPVSDTERTAYHEAGHAVMVYLQGGHVAGCTIDGDENGDGWVMLDRSGMSIDPASLEVAARIGLGGLAADRRVSHVASVGGIHDLMFVLAFLECRDRLSEPGGLCLFADTLEMLLDYENGLPKIRELGDRHREAFGKLLGETRATVNDHWDMVEAVASALLEHGTLTGEQVEEALGSVGAGRKGSCPAFEPC